MWILVLFHVRLFCKKFAGECRTNENVDFYWLQWAVEVARDIEVTPLGYDSASESRPLPVLRVLADSAGSQ